MRRWLALALAAAPLAVAMGCGDDKPRGVEVTEATDTFRAPARPRPSVALDTVYADSVQFTGLPLDSLRRDSLRRDSLPAPAASEPGVAPAPDFGAFWPRFQAAARAGRPQVEALAAFSEAMPRDGFEETFERVFAPPFRDLLLALAPRDFRRDGTAREATVVVGYDADGQVVPQDEAVRESRRTLRFGVVEGAYRLTSVTDSR